MSETFIRLRDDVVSTFEAYANAIEAFNQSDYDPRLLAAMKQRKIDYRNALNEFESYNPKANM